MRLTASQPVACVLLPPILNRLRPALPDIQIELVANDLDAPGMSVAPFEAEPKLVVDPDAPLPFAVPLHLLQSILRRHAQKLQ